MKNKDGFILTISLTMLAMIVACKEENVDATPPGIVIAEPMPNDYCIGSYRVEIGRNSERCFE